jgi:hypothetical protein
MLPLNLLVGSYADGGRGGSRRSRRWWRWCCWQYREEAVRLIGETGSDVESVGVSHATGGCVALAEGDLPEGGVGGGFAGGVGGLAEEFLKRPVVNCKRPKMKSSVISTLEGVHPPIGRAGLDDNNLLTCHTY